MSSYKALIIVVGVIWTIIGGYYLTADHKDPHHGHDHGKMTAKLSAGVNVNFEMLNEEPKVGETLKVMASISSISGPGEYEYKFFMPKNTELLSPSRTGMIQVSENESHTLEIEFTQSVEYDMKVHLELRKPGSPNASMFTFSTLDFQKNLEEVKALQQRKSDYNK